jgi:hypothetical protein
MVHEGSNRMNLFQYSGPSCRAQSASGSKVMSPGQEEPIWVARPKGLGALRAHWAVRVFKYSRCIRDLESSRPASPLQTLAEKTKKEIGETRPTQARRRRYWPSPAPGRGVPGPARVGTQGGSCAGNTVHSVPGGTIRAAEGIFRKSCGSGSGSPQDRRSAYIETDRFSYLSHSQLGQRS